MLTTDQVMRIAAGCGVRLLGAEVLPSAKDVTRRRRQEDDAVEVPELKRGKPTGRLLAYASGGRVVYAVSADERTVERLASRLVEATR